jgi:hypothetical protein
MDGGVSIRGKNQLMRDASALARHSHQKQIIFAVFHHQHGFHSLQTKPGRVYQQPADV